MIETFEYNGKEYQEHLRDGFSAQYAFPFAKKVCKGEGYDIGCFKTEWVFPGAIGIDDKFAPPFNDALNLPRKDMDYIFSSHCLEHIPDWVKAIEHWTNCLKPGGTLFLYLPDFTNEYWRPWNNKKHIHILSAPIIVDLLTHLGYIKIFSSGVDLHDSFTVIGEKQ